MVPPSRLAPLKEKGCRSASPGTAEGEQPYQYYMVYLTSAGFRFRAETQTHRIKTGIKNPANGDQESGGLGSWEEFASLGWGAGQSVVATPTGLWNSGRERVRGGARTHPRSAVLYQVQSQEPAGSGVLTHSWVPTPAKSHLQGREPPEPT